MTCECCHFNPVVQALSTLLKTYSVSIQDHNHPQSTPKPKELSPIAAKLLREQSKKKPKKDVIAALKSLNSKYDDLVKTIESDILPICQKLCLACSRSSNDDNLSRSGQTFVSIDAMATVGLADSGTDPAADIALSDSSDPYAPDDPNDDNSGGSYADDYETKVSQTAHDYLTSHAFVQPRSSQDNEESSVLPSHISDVLRQQFAAFGSLDPFEQMLCLSQWQGQSFASFGTMKWLPKEFERPQSKQLISQRWAKILSKFPVASVVQRSVVSCRNAKSPLAKNYDYDPCHQDELQLPIPSTSKPHSSFSDLAW